MANNYVTVSKDTFKNVTTKESFKLNYKLSPRKITLTENADFSFRQVITPNVEALLIDVHFMSSELNKLAIKSGSLAGALASYPGEWAFLRNGELILQINGYENIQLVAHSSDSDVTTNGLTNASACEELVWYEIDKDILEKICKADSVKMQLSGSKGVWELEGNDFIFMAKTFWNGVYDSGMYADEIQQSESVNKKREEIKRKGCMMEIVIVIIFYILFYALDMSNNDSWFNSIIVLLLLASLIYVAVKRRKKANEIK